MCAHSEGITKSAAAETGVLVRPRECTALAEHSHAKVALEKRKQKLLHCVTKKPYIKTTLEGKNGNT